MDSAMIRSAVHHSSHSTAQNLTKVSVALDWYPNANHAGLVLADQRGYFAEEGLDVELYTPADPTTVLQTVGAGRDTFGISYQTDVLFAREAGGYRSLLPSVPEAITFVRDLPSGLRARTG